MTRKGNGVATERGAVGDQVSRQRAQLEAVCPTTRSEARTTALLGLPRRPSAGTPGTRGDVPRSAASDSRAEHRIMGCGGGLAQRHDRAFGPGSRGGLGDGVDQFLASAMLALTPTAGRDGHAHLSVRSRAEKQDLGLHQLDGLAIAWHAGHRCQWQLCVGRSRIHRSSALLQGRVPG